MFEFLRFQPRLPGLKYFPMESYSTDLVLEGLVVGVDNIRFDVRLSPDFCNKTAKLASLLIEQETGIWTENEKEQLADLSRRQESYGQGYDEIMSDAIDKARAAKEIRVDYLAQIAIVSMVHEEIRKQYDSLIRYCKSHTPPVPTVPPGRLSGLTRRRPRRRRSKLKRRWRIYS